MRVKLHRSHAAEASHHTKRTPLKLKKKTSLRSGHKRGPHFATSAGMTDDLHNSSTIFPIIHHNPNLSLHTSSSPPISSTPGRSPSILSTTTPIPFFPKKTLPSRKLIYAPSKTIDSTTISNFTSISSTFRGTLPLFSRRQWNAHLSNAQAADIIHNGLHNNNRADDDDGNGSDHLLDGENSPNLSKYDKKESESFKNLLTSSKLPFDIVATDCKLMKRSMRIVMQQRHPHIVDMFYNTPNNKKTRVDWVAMMCYLATENQPKQLFLMLDNFFVQVCGLPPLIVDKLGYIRDYGDVSDHVLHHKANRINHAQHHDETEPTFQDDEDLAEYPQYNIKNHDRDSGNEEGHQDRLECLNDHGSEGEGFDMSLLRYEDENDNDVLDTQKSKQKTLGPSDNLFDVIENIAVDNDQRRLEMRRMAIDEEDFSYDNMNMTGVHHDDTLEQISQSLGHMNNPREIMNSYTIQLILQCLSGLTESQSLTDQRNNILSSMSRKNKDYDLENDLLDDMLSHNKNNDDEFVNNALNSSLDFVHIGGDPSNKSQKNNNEDGNDVENELLTHYKKHQKFIDDEILKYLDEPTITDTKSLTFLKYCLLHNLSVTPSCFDITFRGLSLYIAKDSYFARIKHVMHKHHGVTESNEEDVEDEGGVILNEEEREFQANLDQLDTIVDANDHNAMEEYDIALRVQSHGTEGSFIEKQRKTGLMKSFLDSKRILHQIKNKSSTDKLVYIIGKECSNEGIVALRNMKILYLLNEMMKLMQFYSMSPISPQTWTYVLKAYYLKLSNTITVHGKQHIFLTQIIPIYKHMIEFSQKSSVTSNSSNNLAKYKNMHVLSVPSLQILSVCAVQCGQLNIFEQIYQTINNLQQDSASSSSLSFEQYRSTIHGYRMLVHANFFTKNAHPYIKTPNQFYNEIITNTLSNVDLFSALSAPNNNQNQQNLSNNNFASLLLHIMAKIKPTDLNLSSTFMTLDNLLLLSQNNDNINQSLNVLNNTSATGEKWYQTDATVNEFQNTGKLHKLLERGQKIIDDNTEENNDYNDDSLLFTNLSSIDSKDIPITSRSMLLYRKQLKNIFTTKQIKLYKKLLLFYALPFTQQPGSGTLTTTIFNVHTLFKPTIVTPTSLLKQSQNQNNDNQNNGTSLSELPLPIQQLSYKSYKQTLSSLNQSITRNYNDTNVENDPDSQYELDEFTTYTNLLTHLNPFLTHNKRSHDKLISKINNKGRYAQTHENGSDDDDYVDDAECITNYRQGNVWLPGPSVILADFMQDFAADNQKSSNDAPTVTKPPINYDTVNDVITTYCVSLNHISNLFIDFRHSYQQFVGKLQILKTRYHVYPTNNARPDKADDFYANLVGLIQSHSSHDYSGFIEMHDIYEPFDINGNETHRKQLSDALDVLYKLKKSTNRNENNNGEKLAWSALLLNDLISRSDYTSTTLLSLIIPEYYRILELINEVENYITLDISIELRNDKIQQIYTLLSSCAKHSESRRTVEQALRVLWKYQNTQLNQWLIPTKMTPYHLTTSATTSASQRSIIFNPVSQKDNNTSVDINDFNTAVPITESTITHLLSLYLSIPPSSSQVFFQRTGLLDGNNKDSAMLDNNNNINYFNSNSFNIIYTFQLLSYLHKHGHSITSQHINLLFSFTHSLHDVHTILTNLNTLNAIPTTSVNNNHINNITRQLLLSFFHFNSPMLFQQWSHIAILQNNNFSSQFHQEYMYKESLPATYTRRKMAIMENLLSTEFTQKTVPGESEIAENFENRISINHNREIPTLANSQIDQAIMDYRLSSYNLEYETKNNLLLDSNHSFLLEMLQKIRNTSGALTNDDMQAVQEILHFFEHREAHLKQEQLTTKNSGSNPISDQFKEITPLANRNTDYVIKQYDNMLALVHQDGDDNKEIKQRHDDLAKKNDNKIYNMMISKVLQNNKYIKTVNSKHHAFNPAKILSSLTTEGTMKNNKLIQYLIQNSNSHNNADNDILLHKLIVDLFCVNNNNIITMNYMNTILLSLDNIYNINETNYSTHGIDIIKNKFNGIHNNGYNINAIRNLFNIPHITSVPQNIVLNNLEGGTSSISDGTNMMNGNMIIQSQQQYAHTNYILGENGTLFGDFNDYHNNDNTSNPSFNAHTDTTTTASEDYNSGIPRSHSTKSYLKQKQRKLVKDQQKNAYIIHNLPNTEDNDDIIPITTWATNSNVNYLYADQHAHFHYFGNNNGGEYIVDLIEDINNEQSLKINKAVDNDDVDNNVLLGLTYLKKRNNLYLPTSLFNNNNDLRGNTSINALSSFEKMISYAPPTMIHVYLNYTKGISDIVNTEVEGAQDGTITKKNQKDENEKKKKVKKEKTKHQNYLETIQNDENMNNFDEHTHIDEIIDHNDHSGANIAAYREDDYLSTTNDHKAPQVVTHTHDTFHLNSFLHPLFDQLSHISPSSSKNGMKLADYVNYDRVLQNLKLYKTNHENFAFSKESLPVEQDTALYSEILPKPTLDDTLIPHLQSIQYHPSAQLPTIVPLSIYRQSIHTMVHWLKLFGADLHRSHAITALWQLQAGLTVPFDLTMSLPSTITSKFSPGLVDFVKNITLPLTPESYHSNSIEQLQNVHCINNKINNYNEHLEQKIKFFHTSKESYEYQYVFKDVLSPDGNGDRNNMEYLEKLLEFNIPSKTFSTAAYIDITSPYVGELIGHLDDFITKSYPHVQLTPQQQRQFNEQARLENEKNPDQPFLTYQQEQDLYYPYSTPRVLPSQQLAKDLCSPTLHQLDDPYLKLNILLEHEKTGLSTLQRSDGQIDILRHMQAPVSFPPEYVSPHFNNRKDFFAAQLLQLWYNVAAVPIDDNTTSPQINVPGDVLNLDDVVSKKYTQNHFTNASKMQDEVWKMLYQPDELIYFNKKVYDIINDDNKISQNNECNKTNTTNDVYKNLIKKQKINNVNTNLFVCSHHVDLLSSLCLNIIPALPFETVKNIQDYLLPFHQYFVKPHEGAMNSQFQLRMKID